MSIEDCVHPTIPAQVVGASCSNPATRGPAHARRVDLKLELRVQRRRSRDRAMVMTGNDEPTIFGRVVQRRSMTVQAAIARMREQHLHERRGHHPWITVRQIPAEPTKMQRPLVDPARVRPVSAALVLRCASQFCVTSASKAENPAEYNRVPLFNQWLTSDSSAPVTHAQILSN